MLYHQQEKDSMNELLELLKVRKNGINIFIHYNIFIYLRIKMRSFYKKSIKFNKRIK